MQKRETNEKSEDAICTSAVVMANDDSMTRNRKLPGPRERRKQRHELMRLRRREKNKAKRKRLVNAAGIGTALQKKRKRGLNQQEMEKRVEEFEVSSLIYGFSIASS